MYDALKTIIAMGIVTTIFEFLIPENATSRTLKTVSGTVFLAVVAECIINLFRR